jgi:FkbM family methyltransferase
MHNLQILDVGAKFGVHPSNLPLLKFAEHLLIEADTHECAYLEKKYEDYENIKCINALVTSKSDYEINPTKDLLIYAHPGADSIFEPDPENLYWSKFRNGSATITDKLQIQTTTLDKICNEHEFRPSYLKIDIEGAEVLALQGSSHILGNHILCVRIEVEFVSLYKNHEPSFSEIFKILSSHGFVLINFDLAINSFSPFSEFHASTLFGQLNGGDCIFVKNPNNLSELSNVQLLDYALFCLLNNIEDLAIKVLLDCSSLEPFINRFKNQDSSINLRIAFLEKKVASLFFSLKDKPRFSMESFREPWAKIFGTEWISHGDYYRKYPLS